MLNVLLVDDEKLERVLIRKGYNWEENGFNIVGEAASILFSSSSPFNSQISFNLFTS